MRQPPASYSRCRPRHLGDSSSSANSPAQNARSRIGGVLLLHGRIHDHFLLLDFLAMQLRRDFENELHSGFPNPIPEINQITRIAGQAPLKLTVTTEVITRIEHLLEQEQPTINRTG